VSFRKPTGPAQCGRRDDKLRGYPESIITIRADDNYVIMAYGFRVRGLAPAPWNDDDS